MDSMATSLLVGFIIGPSHLQTHPFSKFQRMTSLCCSSWSTTAPSRLSGAPSITVLYHLNKSVLSVNPRLSTRLANLRNPVSLRTFSGTSVPSRYSTGSVLKLRPLHSRNPATAEVPSSSRKLYPRYGSLRSPVAMDSSSLRYNSCTDEPPAHWPMRMITNSAGFTGAMPTSMISRPLSMSSWVMVVRSHLTKNACSGLLPISAPSRHARVRNWLTLWLTRAQSFSSLGSNTAHCVPSSMDFSMKMNRRRTLTY